MPRVPTFCGRTREAQRRRAAASRQESACDPHRHRRIGACIRGCHRGRSRACRVRREPVRDRCRCRSTAPAFPRQLHRLEASARAAGRPRHDRSQHAIPTGTGESAPASADVTAAVAAHVASVANRCATDADAAALRRLFLDNFIVSQRHGRGPPRSHTGRVASQDGRGGATCRLDGRRIRCRIGTRHGIARYELDDTHNETLSHPARPSFPPRWPSRRARARPRQCCSGRWLLDTKRWRWSVPRRAV